LGEDPVHPARLTCRGEFTLTLALSHRGRGDKKPPRSYFESLPPEADLRQHERPHTGNGFPIGVGNDG